MLNGEIGDYVTLARKDRNGEDWYVGGVTDENERTLDLPLDFLDPGKTYVAEVYRDGDGGGIDGDPHSIAIETREARKGDAWSIRIAAGGGFAVRFKAPGALPGS